MSSAVAGPLVALFVVLLVLWAAWEFVEARDDEEHPEDHEEPDEGEADV